MRKALEVYGALVQATEEYTRRPRPIYEKFLEILKPVIDNESKRKAVAALLAECVEQVLDGEELFEKAIEIGEQIGRAKKYREARIALGFYLDWLMTVNSRLNEWDFNDFLETFEAEEEVSEE